MADRELSRDALVSADLFGFPSDALVLLTVLDPYGVAVVDNSPATHIGENRFTYVIPGDILDTPGVWTNRWSLILDENSRTVVQTFTVGRQPLAGVTKHDLRLSVADRVSEVHYGIAASEESQVITDHTLLGGSNEYDNFWVIPNPYGDDAGRFLRVTGFNGSALELSAPFLSPIQPGEPYTLTKINPREIDRAIKMAVAELSPLARLEIFYGEIPVINEYLNLPAGLTHVAAVHTTTGQMTPNSWITRSGRRIGFVVAPTDATLGVSGLRDAAYPEWEDSVIETDEATTVARAALHLHANRAAGQALDQEEHLRRQLAAQDEYERTKRNSVGRIPAGTRPVLE